MEKFKHNLDIVVALLLTVALRYFLVKYALFDRLEKGHFTHFETLLVTNVSLMGAFLGFIITTLTVLAGILPLKIFKHLSKTGRTNELISRFMRLIYVTSLSLIISIVSIFFLKAHFIAVFTMNLVVGIAWLINFISCMGLFESVLKKRFESGEMRE